MWRGWRRREGVFIYKGEKGKRGNGEGRMAEEEGFESPNEILKRRGLNDFHR
jgi:hypothetical protein